MTEILHGYEAACRAAATDQGLDPFTLAARAAGLKVEVWQTGGFTMVAAVRTDGPLYTVTREEGWTLVRSADEAAWDEGEEDQMTVLMHGGPESDVPAADVVAMIRADLVS